MPSQIALSTQQHLHHSTFDVLRLGRTSQSIHARLLRFWDSPNMTEPTEFMGITLLFLDEKDSMINGFIPADRADHYRPSLQEGNIFKVEHFEVERCPHMFKTTEHPFVIRFIHQTSLDQVINNGPLINVQQFLVRQYDHLQILANTNLELPDVVGEIKSVQGYGLMNAGVVSPLLIRFLIAPNVEVYLSLFDDAAAVFKGVLNSGDRTNSVMVVKSVNPEKNGDDLYLNSTAATRFYSGSNLPAITEFTTSLRGSVGQHLPSLHAETVITTNQLTSIGDLTMFLSNSTAQDGIFICKARIIEVLSKNGWWYVSCNRWGKKLDSSATSLPCNYCLDTNAIGIARYRVELLVDDGNNYATFLVFNNELLKLTKQDAATLLHDEVNRGVCNKLPQCIAELEGQDFLFHVRVTPYNSTTNTRTFTVSGIGNMTHTETFSINETPSVQPKYGETSTSVSSRYASTDDVEEGGHTHPSE